MAVYECPECGGEACLSTIKAFGIDTDVAACLECAWEWSEGEGDLPAGFLESREEILGGPTP